MITESSKSNRIAVLPLVSASDNQADALTAVIRRLTSAESLPELMEIVTHAARAMLAADGITFVLREGDRCYYAEEDAIGPLWKGRRFPMSACISGWCMEHGRTVAIADIYEDERIPQDAYRPTFVRSLAMVPVRQEEPIAALGAYWAELHEATPAELELLQTIGNAASLAIAFVQLGEQRSTGTWRRLKRSLPSLRRHQGRLNVWSPSPAFIWSRRLREAAIGLAFAAAACLIRLPLTPLLSNEMPYATFYAAVVLGVMVAGWRAGVIALVTGGLLANFWFVPPIGRFNHTGPGMWSMLVFALVAGTLIGFTQQLVATSQRERELNEKLRLVRGELQHRIKNFITVVQALAIQTGRSSTDAADFDSKFTKRLQALAGAQALIDDPKYASAGLSLLIQRILAPFDVGERVQVAATTEVRVSEDVAVGLALILNELATNALKYGALSSPDGKVSIGCERSGDRARLTWIEDGGPPASAPSSSGFGTRLIRSALPRNLGAAVIDYEPAGVRCRIDFACTG